LSDILTILS